MFIYISMSISVSILLLWSGFLLPGQSWQKHCLPRQKRSLLCMTYRNGARRWWLCLCHPAHSWENSPSCLFSPALLASPIPRQQEQLASCSFVSQHGACLLIQLFKSLNLVHPGPAQRRPAFHSWSWVSLQRCLYFWEFAWPGCSCQVPILAVCNAICDSGKHNMFPKVLMVKVIPNI